MSGTLQGYNPNFPFQGGYLIYSILAEMRVQTELLALIANVPVRLPQMRADAIADMGNISQAYPSTPIQST